MFARYIGPRARCSPPTIHTSRRGKPAVTGGAVIRRARRGVFRPQAQALAARAHREDYALPDSCPCLFLHTGFPRRRKPQEYPRLQSPRPARAHACPSRRKARSLKPSQSPGSCLSPAISPPVLPRTAFRRQGFKPGPRCVYCRAKSCGPAPAIITSCIFPHSASFYFFSL